MRSVAEQAFDERRLVDVVGNVLPDLAEGLDADGKPAPRHGRIVALAVPATGLQGPTPSADNATLLARETSSRNRG